MLTLKKCLLAGILASASVLPANAQSTAGENQQQTPTEIDNSAGTSGLNTSPWNNGASATASPATIIGTGSNVGTEDQGNNSNGTGRTDNLNGTTGNGTAGNGNAPGAPRGGLRTNGTITREGRDPGGNPDVPFDSNMNIGFLALGIAFAAFLLRKRWKLQPVATKQ
jgi:hypothetical protein